MFFSTQYFNASLNPNYSATLFVAIPILFLIVAISSLSFKIDIPTEASPGFDLDAPPHYISYTRLKHLDNMDIVEI